MDLTTLASKFDTLMNNIKTYIDTHKAADTEKFEGQTPSEFRNDTVTGLNSTFIDYDEIATMFNNELLVAENRIWLIMGNVVFDPVSRTSSNVFDTDESITAAAAIDDATFLLFGSKGHAAKITVSGSTYSYTSVTTNLTTTITSAYENSSLTVIGTDQGEVYESNDDGETFSAVNLDLTGYSTSPVNRIRVDSTGKWFLFKEQAVIRSTSTGWEEAALPAIGVMYSGDIGPSDEIYIAGDNGVFESTDGGDTWSFVDSGATQPTRLVRASKHESLLIVGDDDAVVFREKPAEMWETLPTNYGFTAAESDPDGLWVALDGNGDVQRSIDDGKGWRVVDERNDTHSVFFDTHRWLIGLEGNNYLESLR